MNIVAWLIGLGFLILGFVTEGVDSAKNIVCSQIWFAAVFLAGQMKEKWNRP